MGIDPKTLSPAAQAQIAAKLLQNQRERAATAHVQRARGKRKYHNTPTTRTGAEGKEIHFQSKKEAARYDELMLLLQAGVISDLKLQPQFTLQESYVTPDGVRVRAITYIADFSYWKDGEFVVEDVKSDATRTRVYGMKKKLMYERGISIKEV